MVNPIHNLMTMSECAGDAVWLIKNDTRIIDLIVLKEEDRATSTEMIRKCDDPRTHVTLNTLNLLIEILRCLEGYMMV